VPPNRNRFLKMCGTRLIFCNSNTAALLALACM
jgi:hypothetical protein